MENSKLKEEMHKILLNLSSYEDFSEDAKPSPAARQFVGTCSLSVLSVSLSLLWLCIFFPATSLLLNLQSCDDFSVDANSSFQRCP